MVTIKLLISFQFSCGGWQKLNPIPDGHSSWSMFEKMWESNQVSPAPGNSCRKGRLSTVGRLKGWFVINIFRFQKGFDVGVLEMAFFVFLALILAILSKNWAKIFSNHGRTEIHLYLPFEFSWFWDSSSVA
jgi:hypothetical protein